jgi:hypothetical protein
MVKDKRKKLSRNRQSGASHSKSTQGGSIMAANRENEVQQNKAPVNQEKHEIDRSAPAGTENSLGAQSVHDGRPATDDSVVEAIDELSPGKNPPVDER